MKTVIVNLERVSAVRLNKVLLDLFFEDVKPKFVRIFENTQSDSYNNISVEIDEETMFRIALQYGSIDGAIDVYRESNKNEAWKVVVGGIESARPEWKNSLVDSLN